jgi:hypothetical protein
VFITAAALVLTILNPGLAGLTLAGLAIGWAARSRFLRSYGEPVTYGIACLVSIRPATAQTLVG